MTTTAAVFQPAQQRARSTGRVRSQLRWRYVGLVLAAFGLSTVVTNRVPGLPVLVIAGVLGLFVSAMTIRKSSGWLSPLGLPLLYITVVHTVPLIAAERWMFEGRDITIVNGLVGRYMANDATTTALGLMIIGFLSAAALTWNGVLPSTELGESLDRPIGPEVLTRLRKIGLVALWLAIAMQAVYVYRNGFSRFAPTAFDKELTTMGRILMFAGVACIVVVAGQSAKLGLRSIEIWLVVGVFVLAATWGSRAALLAPLLLLAFAITVRRPSSTLRVRAMALAGLLVFILVAETRIRGASNLEGFSLLTVVERSIRDINAPTYLTYYTYEGLTGDNFALGSTYLGAIPHLIPTVLVDQIGVDLPQLATARYRELINFDRSDRGFGFGVVAEAVINFGAAGALLAGFVLGLVSGKSYRVMGSRLSYSVTRRWFYPLLFASVPWIVRSDILQGFKPMLYALGAIAVTTFAVKKRTASAGVLRA